MNEYTLDVKARLCEQIEKQNKIKRAVENDDNYIYREVKPFTPIPFKVVYIPWTKVVSHAFGSAIKMGNDILFNI